MLAFEAGEFDRSLSANVTLTPQWGEGMVTNSMGANSSVPNKVVYKFDCGQAGNYLLEIDYAAGTERRPCTVIVNGSLINDSALGGFTGGWTSAEVIPCGVGRVVLKQGVNRLEIFRNAAIPHLRRIRFKSVG